jgi:hypothetical protein
MKLDLNHRATKSRHDPASAHKMADPSAAGAIGTMDHR